MLSGKKTATQKDVEERRKREEPFTMRMNPMKRPWYGRLDDGTERRERDQGRMIREDPLTLFKKKAPIDESTSSGQQVKRTKLNKTGNPGRNY